MNIETLLIGIIIGNLLAGILRIRLIKWVPRKKRYEKT